ncbi:MAG: hypothetical protein IPK10_09840 [Bacteroidetes bacterium]|nr:hypothetical protein [Bacteroidota bacterium]
MCYAGGMSGKFRSQEEFQKFAINFFPLAMKGYPLSITEEEMWRQIESFSGYSFSKGTRRVMRWRVIQSLYLKTLSARISRGLINNFGGFSQYAEFYVHEARVCGANIHAPDINKSVYLTDIHDRDIYLGFIQSSKHTIAKL